MVQWDEFQKIRDKESLLQFFNENKQQLKKLVLPAVVISALLIFWIFGGDDKSITEDLPKGDASLFAEEESVQESEEQQEQSAEDDRTEVKIYVDIGGAIKNPGVYEVNTGTRLFEVINQAGGLTEEADRDSMNQAEVISDGQKIIIKSTNPQSPYYTETPEKDDSDTGNSFMQDNEAVIQNGNGVVVNINEGDSTELQLIPGIGPATADKIIAYREENGPFQDIAEIKNVRGIGEKTYEALKDYICV